MNFPIHITQGFEGSSLDVDCDLEMITLLGADQTPLGTLTWAALITFIRETAPTTAASDGRAHPRTPLALKVRYHTPDGRELESLTLDVGGGGLFIEATKPLPPGTELSVEFTLPDPPWDRITAKARVAWVRRTAERYMFFPGMGLQFTEIPEGGHEKIHELVETLTRMRCPVA